MTVCGHQFLEGDGSDWVLSTSVGCLEESTTASRILQELFKKRCRNLPTETLKKRPKAILTSPTKRTPPPKNNHPQDTLIVRRIPDISPLEHFDESQHLNGCPIKWLYHRRLLDKKKHFRVQRLCDQRAPRKEVKRHRATNLRDSTPVEIKIHKINLTEKYTSSCDDLPEKVQQNNLAARRKQLAAKLNWKLHDDCQEPPGDTLSERGSRHDYFPPRPLLGLKPLLSVLLAPQKTNCCCLLMEPRSSAPQTKGRSVSLTIQSLDLSLPPREQQPRTRLSTTNPSRWRSKSSVSAKKLQVPHQITVKFDQRKQNSASDTHSDFKGVHVNPRAKRVSEQRKQTKSLSSLFYELRGKSSHGVDHGQEMLEAMIGDLTAEGQFKMRRFLKLEADGGGGRGCEKIPGRGGKLREGKSAGSKEPNPACGKTRFFKKPNGVKPAVSLEAKAICNFAFPPPSRTR